MGEITDMIIDGVLDEDGGYIGGQNKVSCPQCYKRVKPAGLKMHIRDVHGATKDLELHEERQCIDCENMFVPPPYESCKNQRCCQVCAQYA